MKTMLWKELRENFKWALLALLALLAAEFYALTVNRETQLTSYEDLTLCSSAFEMVTAFGCAAVGAGLALVQILPELRRDQWAALLHRPVPRGTIFFGKAWAGLLLYLGATVLPFCACVYYVATPGQFAAPLVPGMMIPGLSDLFLGPMFYFAAVLLCLHRGAWWGSRGAIGLSVIPILIEHLTGGWPFLVPIVATLVYLAAAWGAMLSNGGTDHLPRAGRFALAVTVLVGAETALLAFVWLLQIIPRAHADAVFAGSTQFEVTNDGQVFLQQQKGDGGVIITDLNGKPVTDPHYTGNRSQGRFRYLEPFAEQIGGQDVWQYAYWLKSPRNFQNYVQKYNAYATKEVWYKLIAANSFIGYDKVSRRAVGICDATGFHPPGTTPVPFAGELKQSFFSDGFFWFKGHLYSLDFPDRKMTTFGVDGSHVYGAGSPIDYGRAKPAFVAVALESGLRFFTPEGATLFDLPYFRDPSIWSFLSIGSNPAGDVVYLQSDSSYFGFRNPGLPPLPTYLDVLDLHGKRLQTYSKPGDSEDPAPPTWSKQVAVFLSPFLPALVGTIHADEAPTPKGLAYSVLDNEGVPQPALDLTPGDLGIVFALNLALGIVALACARVVGFFLGRSLGWAAFVTCFGLAGLAVFRLASDWPRRVRCPQCGAYRALKATTCPHCHTGWATPEALGTELFDHAPFVPVSISAHSEPS